MPFVKVIKNKAYFKRYQVKYRRRREGKTDYYARRKLVTQDKNKYSSPKYRLVVRFTNTQVICQIAYSEIVGDKILCQATSNELPRYGLSVGLKNYGASYCTGLLLARRLLQKLGLDELYPGNEEVTGEISSTEVEGRKFFVSEVDDDKRPFRAYLDVGVKATTTGSRLFAALKGASDGGLDIPHNEKRFPGYSKDEKTYDADAHKERIFGAHIAEYMEELEGQDGTALKERFASYLDAGINGDGLEELYEKVHAAIREDPSPAPKKDFSGDKAFKRAQKLTYDERKAAVTKKLLTSKKQVIEEMEEDEEA